MPAAILENRLQRWLNRRHGSHSGTVTLQRRCIYILPSRLGYVFCVIWLVMLLWAINYINSLAFILTFLLAAVSLNAMWRTHNNLLGLDVTPGAAEAVFAGQQARFCYYLTATARPHYGVGLQWGKTAAEFSDVAAGQTVQLALTIPTTRRGRLQPGPIRVITYFPLGLFRAWSWLVFKQHCLVYPAPAGALPLPLANPQPRQLPSHNRSEHANQPGSDDFNGLRNYARGDSLRHIAWRASARSASLLTKQFNGQSRDELWLDWQQLPGLATEARLSQLCQWVLRADSQDYDYGLRLPDSEISPAHGAEHRRRCLQALALFEPGLV